MISTFIFLHLNPTAKACRPLLLLPSDWDQIPPEGAVCLGLSRRAHRVQLCHPGPCEATVSCQGHRV